MLVGVAVMLILPNNITTARFLREEERTLALQRLRGVEHGTGNKELYGLPSPLYQFQIISDKSRISREEKFAWSEVRRAVLSPQTWLSANAYFGLLTGIYSFGIFVRYVRRNAFRLSTE